MLGSYETLTYIVIIITIDIMARGMSDHSPLLATLGGFGLGAKHAKWKLNLFWLQIITTQDIVQKALTVF